MVSVKPATATVIAFNDFAWCFFLSQRLLRLSEKGKNTVVCVELFFVFKFIKMKRFIHSIIK